MGFTTATRDEFLNDLDALATHVSLHTADPGSTGASEVSGGSYTRQAVTWAAASGGSKTAGAMTFQIPAGTTITHFGLWSAASGGTFVGGGALDAAQSYPTGGTYDFTPTVTST